VYVITLSQGFSRVKSENFVGPPKVHMTGRLTGRDNSRHTLSNAEDAVSNIMVTGVIRLTLSLQVVEHCWKVR
jgi:hypothetical protein